MEGNVVQEFGQLLSTINNSTDGFKLGKQSHRSSKDIAIKQVDEATGKKKLSQRDSSSVEFVYSKSDIGQISKDNSNQRKTDAGVPGANVARNVGEVHPVVSVITDIHVDDVDNAIIHSLLSQKKVYKQMDAGSMTLGHPTSSVLHDLKENIVAPSSTNAYKDHYTSCISKWTETVTDYKFFDEKFIELSAANNEEQIAQTFLSKQPHHNYYLLYSSLGKFVTMVEHPTHNFDKHYLLSISSFTSSKRELSTVVRLSTVSEQLMPYNFEKDYARSLRQQSGIVVEQFSQYYFQRKEHMSIHALSPTTNQKRFVLRSGLDTNRLDMMFRHFRPVRPQGQSQDYLSYTCARLFYYLFMLQPHDTIQVKFMQPLN